MLSQSRNQILLSHWMARLPAQQSEYSGNSRCLFPKHSTDPQKWTSGKTMAIFCYSDWSWKEWESLKAIMLPVLRQYTNYSERNARPYCFMALIGSGYEPVTDKREEKNCRLAVQKSGLMFWLWLSFCTNRAPQPFLAIISSLYCNQAELGHVRSILSLGIPSTLQKTIAWNLFPHPLKMIGFRQTLYVGHF